uniref:Glutathione S-transferase n=1 Tax=Vombatus ursinus TaxID=29139 RepID=A0A4X2L9D2_VOMUR
RTPNMPIILGYWDIRGLGWGYCLFFPAAPDFDKSQWLDVKFSLGLDFPNLPYLIDGDHKITQSSAILRYIWGGGHAGMVEEKKPDFYGLKVRTWPQGKLPPYQLMANVSFFLSQEVLKIEYLEQLPGQLKLFSLFLGKWTWFAGDKITYVDFLVCDVLDQNRKFDPCCLDDFANLKRHMYSLHHFNYKYEDIRTVIPILRHRD